MRIFWGSRRQSVSSLVVVVSVALLAAGCSAAGAQPVSVVTTASPALPSESSQPVRSVTAEENAKPGTADWRIAPARLAGERELAGYTDRVSARPGEPFRMFVSSRVGGYVVRAFRLGWYGGKGGRLVWTSPALPGLPQAAPTIAADRMVEARWQPSLTVPTTGWPAGTYLLQLTAANGKQKYVPMTIRSESVQGAVVIVNEVTTYQAYNVWGGHSLYWGPDRKFVTRSYRVSFDRPYAANGAQLLLAYEQPLIQLAERTGVPIAYLTSRDLDVDPNALTGARGFVSPGHDEYWTAGMRATVTKARDAGTNLAFLGANAVYWRARFEPGLNGPGRIMAGYKSAAADPVKDSPTTTVKWRSVPHADAENSLTGLLYDCFPASGSFVVRKPGFFLFEGTGARQGSTYPGLIGLETDRANQMIGTPSNLEVVAHSPVKCGGTRQTFADTGYYTVASGAGVFSTGTMGWVHALAGPDARTGITAASAGFAQKVTTNLLTAMAAAPMGLDHPASADYLSVAIPRS